jgi:DNA replication and repair protein RecF
MFVKKLRLFQFRNLRSGDYFFPEQVSFIIGNNGQGKSNLIEAISFLSSARSFRTTSVRDLVSWETDACSVFASVKGAATDFEIGVSIEAGKRKAFINGDKVASINEYVGELTSVSFAPADLALVQGAPSFRRQFIEKHLVDIKPTIFKSLMTYHRVLQHRNALLKKGERSAQMFSSLDTILIEEAIKIEKEKRIFIDAVAKKAQYYYQKLSQAKDGELSLEFVTNVPTAGEEAYKEQLAKNFERDLITQSTRIGPHRDDIEIKLAGKEARSFASQGQVRSIVLSMKLAVLDLIEELRADSPVLLLDDIESELDKNRMEELLAILFSKPRQVILTGTELTAREHFEDQPYQVFSIVNGMVNILK